MGWLFYHIVIIFCGFVRSSSRIVCVDVSSRLVCFSYLVIPSSSYTYRPPHVYSEGLSISFSVYGFTVNVCSRSNRYPVRE